jgi:hypothetical protein
LFDCARTIGYDHRAAMEKLKQILDNADVNHGRQDLFILISLHGQMYPALLSQAVYKAIATRNLNWPRFVAYVLSYGPREVAYTRLILVDILGQLGHMMRWRLGVLLNELSEATLELLGPKVREPLGAMNAGQVYALIVLLCDDYFVVSREHRFFAIARRLPMELQMLLAKRAYERWARVLIARVETEDAFARWLFR